MTSHVLASPRLASRVVSDTLLILLAWCGVAAFLIVQHVPLLLTAGPTDPDSQMRLVEVRDYLAGQAWTDLRQLRLDPPLGVMMHWSRLIDWPLASLIRLARPILGPERAEVFAITVWPLLLYLVFLIAITSVARRLAGQDAVIPALAFAIFAAPATTMFLPGHITHHNAQIALFSVLLALAVRIDRGEVIGLFAGLVAAAMLAIGLETLPLVGVVGFGLAVTWALAPASTRPGLYGFGLFYAAGMLLQRAFAAAPSDWFATSCDVASFPYVAVGLIGGFGVAGLVRLDPAAMTTRFAGLALVSTAALIAVIAINPHCLAGPYAEVDPRIIPLWLDHVEEAHSFGQLAVGAPWQLIGLYLAPFLALGPTSWAFASAARSERAGWGLTLLLLMTALAVALWQARGATFAAVLVVPGMAYAVTEVRRKCTPHGSLILLFGLVAAYVVPNQAIETIAADFARHRLSPRPHEPSAPDGSRLKSPYEACAARGSFAALAVQPPGLVLTESNLGPSVLLDTPHGTLAAPYHRNAQGLIDGLTALEASPEAASVIIARRHVAYVATCSQDPEVALIREIAPDGLLARLIDGNAPAWLQPIQSEGPLKLWRVVGLTTADAPDPVNTGSVARRQQTPAGPPLPPLPTRMPAAPMQMSAPIPPDLRGTL